MTTDGRRHLNIEDYGIYIGNPGGNLECGSLSPAYFVYYKGNQAAHYASIILIIMQFKNSYAKFYLIIELLFKSLKYFFIFPASVFFTLYLRINVHC